MGAATVVKTYNRPGSAIVRSNTTPDLRLFPITFTMSNSYATGGDTITAATMPQLVAGNVVDADLFPTVNGYTFKLDIANSKMLAYVSGGTQVTAAVDLSTLGALTLFMAVRRA